MPQRSSRTPTRIGIPPILIDLITIYDDDDGSTTSYIAPIPIIYEELLGGMFSLTLEGPLQDLERRGITIENTHDSVTFP
jgi:hypothetical protein